MYYYFQFYVFMDCVYVFMCVYPCVGVFLQFSLLFVSKEKEKERSWGFVNGMVGSI